MAAGINLYRCEAHHILANIYAGHDPGALALARELKHPLTHAVALAFASFVRQFRREPKIVREFSRQTFTHCTEHGFRFYAP